MNKPTYIVMPIYPPSAEGLIIKEKQSEELKLVDHKVLPNEIDNSINRVASQKNRLEIDKAMNAFFSLIEFGNQEFETVRDHFIHLFSLIHVSAKQCFSMFDPMLQFQTALLKPEILSVVLVPNIQDDNNEKTSIDSIIHVAKKKLLFLNDVYNFKGIQYKPLNGSSIKSMQETKKSILMTAVSLYSTEPTPNRIL